jgi:hypothetical protein
MNLPPRTEQNGADETRDAHLREALRHAPDAALDAPPALKDNILRQARLAVAPTAMERDRSAGVLQRLGAAWSWLARPPVTAGFASLMVATLVGLMWSSRQIDVPTTEGSARDAAVPVPAQPAAPRLTEPAAATEPTARPAEAPGAMMKRSESPASTEPAKPRPSAPTPELPGQAGPLRVSPEQERRGKTEIASEAGKAAAAVAARSVQARQPATPPASARADDHAEPTSQMVRGGGTATGSATIDAGREVPAAAGNAAAEAFSPSTTAEMTAVPGASPDAQADIAETRAKVPAAASPAAGAMSLTPGPDSGGVAAGNPAARLRADVAASAQRWTWQRGSEPERAMNGAMLAWLAALEAATPARWQSTSSAEASRASAVLHLKLDGRPHTQILLDADAVGIDHESGRGLRASLAPRAASALRDALDHAAR